jgi:hypothetical protein
MKFVESNDFDCSFITVITALKAIYGERGSILANGYKYIKHQEERKNDEQASLDSIPELTIKDIFKLTVAQFEDYEMQGYLREKRRFIDYALCTDGKNWTENERKQFVLENYIEFAGYLGLLRDREGVPHYRWIVDFDNITDDEWSEITKNMREKLDLFKALIDCLIDMYIDGYSGEDGGRRVLKQESTRFYFRGENAFYSTSKASIYRNRNNESLEEKLINQFINQMKLEEFRILLNGFDVVSKWNYSDVWIEALAQHYGFLTDLMDISSDLLTALFFLCCKWDKEKGWVPLEERDFESIESRMHIAQLGGDSRYGILYALESEAVNLFKLEKVMPIGYQPFLRCSAQHGYCLCMTETDDLYSNPFFRKYKIRLTTELCQSVFQVFDQGKRIYPYEGLMEIQDVLQSIKGTNCFSRQAYNAAVTVFKNKLDETTIERILKDKEITIKGTIEFIDRHRMKMQNEKYNAIDYEKIYQFENVGRPTLIPVDE